MEAYALREQYQKDILPPNIRTLVSEGKKVTSERPGDISGKMARRLKMPLLPVLRLVRRLVRRRPAESSIRLWPKPDLGREYLRLKTDFLLVNLGGSEGYYMRMERSEEGKSWVEKRPPRRAAFK